MASVVASVAVAERPRAFVRVSGPQAGAYLQRIVSNDVLALAPGEACDALLLTPKARVVATMRVVRRREDDYLLLTEPELGGVLRSELRRMRFAARCEIEPEEHRSHVRLGADARPPQGVLSVPTSDYGVPAFEVVDADPPGDDPRLSADELERLRIEAATPLFGKEIDDRVLPAEAGLVERAVDFAKGCYPGQEPVARLHYRGHANRALRVLRVHAPGVPAAGAEILHEGKAVGRITSSVATEDGAVALAYVRVKVPTDAELSVEGARATMAAPRP